MANRYWVGGNANWDGAALTKWSTTSGGAGGAAVPTSADDVFFDAASGAITCTVTTVPSIKSINFTGFTGAFTGSNPMTVAGSLTLAAGQTYSYTGGLIISGTGTLTTAGKTVGPVTINGSGITVTLGGALTLATNADFTMLGGAFTTSASNFSVTCRSFTTGSGSTKTLTLNASTITVSQNFSVLDTVNAGTSTINLTGATSVFSGAGRTFNNVSFTSTASNTRAITGTNTFATLTLSAASSDNATYSFFGQTISTLVCSGNSAINRIRLISYAAGSSITLSVTTWATISDIDFQDITLSPSRSGTRLGNYGNTSGITFVTRTVYWNLAGSQAFTATGWATTSGGTPALNNFPLAQDTMVFDNAGAAGTVTFNTNYRVGTLSASTKTSAYSLAGNMQLQGNVTLGGAVISTASGTFSFVSRSAQTIRTNGIVIGNELNASSSFSTLSLLDAVTCNIFNVSNSGSLSTGGFSVTAGTVVVAGTLTMLSSTIVASSSGNAFTYSSGTVTGTGTISLTSASAKTFRGNGVSISGITLNQGGAGALTITGANTFGNITNTYGATSATSILFTAGTTSTFTNWNANGQSGRLLTIGSVTAASHTLSKSSGTVNANFLSISRSTATGGATWNALNSIDGGNNAGWNFGAPGTGNFLMMFM